MRMAAVGLGVVLLLQGCASSENGIAADDGNPAVETGPLPYLVRYEPGKATLSNRQTYLVERDCETAILMIGQTGASLVTNRWRDDRGEHFAYRHGAGEVDYFVLPWDRARPLRYYHLGPSEYDHVDTGAGFRVTLSSARPEDEVLEPLEITNLIPRR